MVSILYFFFFMIMLLSSLIEPQIWSFDAESPCEPTAPPESSFLLAVGSVSFLHMETRFCSRFELVRQPTGRLPVTDTGVAPGLSVRSQQWL